VNFGAEAHFGDGKFWLTDVQYDMVRSGTAGKLGEFAKEILEADHEEAKTIWQIADEMPGRPYASIKSKVSKLKSSRYLQEQPNPTGPVVLYKLTNRGGNAL
jgi:hypothetical protein